jgi:hypothetical protein
MSRCQERRRLLQGELSNDVFRRVLWRFGFSIDCETVVPWNRRYVVASEKIGAPFCGRCLASLHPIGVADPLCGLSFGAIQEHGKYSAAIPDHIFFQLIEEIAILRFRIAESDDYERNVVLYRRLQY